MSYRRVNALPWLLLTLTLSESVRLEVGGRITAECGKPVILHCNISSALTGLSIQHMEWSQSHTFCSVDSGGYLTIKNAERDFHCHYDKGHLSLHFYKWLPGFFEHSFMCKLRSNQGILHKYTHVEIKEHLDSVRAVRDSLTPTCTFTKVCPGGEVEWFEDFQKITNQSFIVTNKHVKDGRWLINSYLKTHSSNKHYNCSLKSSTSGRYLSSAVMPPVSVPFSSTRAAAHGPVRPSLWIILGFLLQILLLLRFV